MLTFWCLRKIKRTWNLCNAVFIIRKGLKAFSPVKINTNNQTFQRKNIHFWNHFLSSFLIFILILVILLVLHINLIYKVWVDLINKRQQKTHSLLGNKRIPWNKPTAVAMGASWKLQLFESNKGSFYNQANWIEEYKYKGLY